MATSLALATSKHTHLVRRPYPECLTIVVIVQKECSVSDAIQRSSRSPWGGTPPSRLPNAHFQYKGPYDLADSRCTDQSEAGTSLRDFQTDHPCTVARRSSLSRTSIAIIRSTACGPDGPRSGRSCPRADWHTQRRSPGPGCGRDAPARRLALRTTPASGERAKSLTPLPLARIDSHQRGIPPKIRAKTTGHHPVTQRVPGCMNHRSICGQDVERLGSRSTIPSHIP